MQFKHTYDVKFINFFIPNCRLGFCGSNNVNFIIIGLVEVFLNCILRQKKISKFFHQNIRSGFIKNEVFCP
jgi:hypothetical protein